MYDILPLVSTIYIKKNIITECLRKHVNLSFDTGRNDYWLGASKVSPGVWKWVSGKPVATELWSPGEPNSPDPNSCIHYWLAEVRLLWDAGCWYPFRPICEYTN